MVCSHLARGMIANRKHDSNDEFPSISATSTPHDRRDDPMSGFDQTEALFDVIKTRLDAIRLLPPRMIAAF
jgi:hypothetical protein